MKFKIISLSLLLFIAMSSGKKEAEELFVGEFKFASCKHEIPFTYKAKDDTIVTLKAKELEGQELAIVVYNKKTKTTTYSKYYLVSETIDNRVFNFFQKKKDYEAKEKTAVLIRYTAKYYRFYTAVCFEKILNENPELKDSIKEVE